MEIEGMIIQILKPEGGVSQRTGNPWKKQGYVLETITQFPRKIKFDVFGEKADTLTFEVGKTYSVQVDVESREFNERWYTDLRAYNARLIEPGSVGQSPVGGGYGAPANPYGQPSNPYSQPTPQANPYSQPQAPASNPFPTEAPGQGFAQTDNQDDLPF